MNYNYLKELIFKSKSFGYRKISKNGSELIGHVPHVASEAWFHILFKPLNNESILEVEKKLNLKIHDDFSTFLKFSNGISIFNGELSIYGFRKVNTRSGDDIWQPFDIVIPNTFERPENLENDALVIGSYFYDGSKLYLQYCSGKVFRCDSKDASKVYNNWDSLYEMLNDEARRLSLFFDDKGKRFDISCPLTPDPDQ